MDRSERTVRCPVCGRPTAWHENPHRPFCSERCRLADLAGWLSDRYVIPGDPEEAVAPPLFAQSLRRAGSSSATGKHLTSYGEISYSAPMVSERCVLVFA